MKFNLLLTICFVLYISTFVNIHCLKKGLLNKRKRVDTHMNSTSNLKSQIHNQAISELMNEDRPSKSKTAKTGRVLLQYARDLKNLQTVMVSDFIENDKTQLNGYGVIYKKNKKFHLGNNKTSINRKDIVAEIFYHRTLNQTGWNKLSVHTYSNVNPYLQTYLAGYLEGRASSEDIFNFFTNIKINKRRESSMFKKSGDKSEFELMEEFFKDVNESLSSKIQFYMNSENKVLRKNWSRLLLGYSQLWGLMAGYTKQIKTTNEYEKKKLTMADMLILQADGEVPELIRYFSYKQRNQKTQIGDKDYFKKAFEIEASSPDEFWEKFLWHSKCSAFIKLVKDGKGNWSDILTGHNTWSDYYEMNRTYKHYKFEFEDNKVFKPNELIFSSYPGALSSTDDFYLGTNNLLVMETTIEVVDVNEFKYVKPPHEYIPNFMRVLAATRFAKSGKEWIDMFKIYNSGTYSSQWMIIDYNLFKTMKGTKKQPKGFFYVAEQNPKQLIYHDISKYLYSNGYFSSFNRAFLPQSKIDLHIQLIKNVYGDRFGYKGSERGKIFRHFAMKVANLLDLKRILRYNGFNKKQEDFLDDPSYKNAANGISSRFDLSLFFNQSGGTDCKLTNYELSQKMTALAVTGPTTDDNLSLPRFIFKKGDPTSILGLPDHFDFSWIVASPRTMLSKKPHFFNWEK